MKIKLFFLLLVCAFIDASGMTLWEKYWKDDLRQFPTTQVDKYFADIVDLASPCGAIPAARVKVARKSFRLGKPKVLFILPYQEARYPFELFSRFDMQYDMLPVSLFTQRARKGAGFKKVSKAYNSTLLDDIEKQKFDVIVTRNFNADALSAAELARICSWISNGLGWVDLGVMGPESANVLRRLLPLSGGRWIRRLPSETAAAHFISSGSAGISVGTKVQQKVTGKVLLQVQKDPAVAVREHGKGRIVSHPVQWIHGEANYALLMKCIAWCAGKTSFLPFKTSSSGSVLHIQFPAELQREELVVEWTALHENGISRLSGRKKISPGKTAVSLENQMPSGKVELHYSLVGKERQLLDWGIASLYLPDNGVAVSVVLPEMYDRRKNTFSGEMIFSNSNPQPISLKYTLTLFDGQGRKLPFEKNGTLTVNGEKKLPFRFNCSWNFLYGPVGFLHLSVQSNGSGKVRHLLRQAFFVPHQPSEALKDWQCGVWGSEVECNVSKTTPFDGLTAIFAPVLREHGVNTIGDGVWRYPDDLFPAAREGFYIQTEYLATLFGTWHKSYKDHVFMPKKNYIPPWFEKGKNVLKQQTGRIRQLRKLGVLNYACDEEIGLGPSETCFSEETRKMFAAWCLKKYGSLENISKNWGTALPDVNSLRGILLADALKRDPANPAQWLDFRFFMEECFNGAVEEYVRLGKKAAPEAFFGYGAGPHTDIPNQGHNRSRLGKSITASVEYLGPFFRQGSVPRNFDILRSRKVPMLTSVAGYPYHMIHSGEQYPSCAWYTALHGGCGIMYYAAIHPSLWGKLHPTGAPNGATLRLKEANKDLRNGIGKIILSSKRKAGIGIYYSRKSQYLWHWRKSRNQMLSGRQTSVSAQKMAEQLRDDPGGGLMPDKKSKDLVQHLPAHGFAAMRELASGSGYGYDIVFPDQLLSGELRKNYRILMMPGILSLSSREFAALKDFVRSGGILICDMQTGIYDSYGKKNPELAEIEKFLGIRRINNTLSPVPVKARAAAGGFELDGFACEKITVSGKGKCLASGSTAFAVLSRFGKGKTLYLNTIPKKGGKWMQWAWDPMQVSGGLRKYFHQLGKEALLPEPPVAGLADTDIVRFDGSGAEYVFLSRGYQKNSVKSVLKNPGGKYIHDMRNRRFLGRKTQLQLPEFAPAYTAAYSLADFRIRQLQLKMPEQIKCGQTAVLEIEPVFEGQMPEYAILTCSFYAPDGRKEWRFSKNIKWEKSRNRYFIFPALNEKRGNWKVVVSDVTGSVSAEKVFKLEGE